MTKKEIALRNLKLLGVQADCIKAFEADESIWCSERVKTRIEFESESDGREGKGSDEENFIVIGVLYAVRDGYTFEKEVKEAIKAVKKDGYFPYHVIQTRFEFGNTFSVLYVPGDDAEEDLLKKEDFNSKYGYELCSYVYNADALDCSEYGYICIKGAGGGIIRTA